MGFSSEGLKPVKKEHNDRHYRAELYHDLKHLAEFGSKFADLPEENRNAVSKAVPLKISEAEPRNIKK